MCRKFLLSAIFSMAILLTACSQRGSEVTETAAESSLYGVMKVRCPDN